MENMETVNSPQEEPPQQERVERVARCIECSNEWIATNGNEPKPSRCPVCMSRDVKWRDECTGDEISKKDVKKTLKKATKPKSKRAPPKRNPDGSFAKSVTTAGSPASNLPAEATSTHSATPAQQKAPELFSLPEYYNEEEDEEEEEFTYEDAKAAIPRIPMQSIVLLIGAAAIICGILFLVRKAKSSNLVRREAPKEVPQEAPRRPVPMPTFTFGGNLA